jgi:uncharacterized membrane protein (DUF373 family)
MRHWNNSTKLDGSRRPGGHRFCHDCNFADPGGVAIGGGVLQKNLARRWPPGGLAGTAAGMGGWAVNEPGEKVEAWVMRSAAAFLWVEHAAYVALGALLSLAAVLALGGAATVMVAGMADWSSTHEIYLIIDRLLFVLMLIEILHTVRASMRGDELTAQPFLVVGLIASIRRILLITLQSSEATKEPTLSDAAERMFRASMIELAVLTILILVMVVSLRILQPPAPPRGEDKA